MSAPLRISLAINMNAAKENSKPAPKYITMYKYITLNLRVWMHYCKKNSGWVKEDWTKPRKNQHTQISVTLSSAAKEFIHLKSQHRISQSTARVCWHERGFVHRVGATTNLVSTDRKLKICFHSPYISHITQTSSKKTHTPHSRVSSDIFLDK